MKHFVIPIVLILLVVACGSEPEPTVTDVQAIPTAMPEDVVIEIEQAVEEVVEDPTAEPDPTAVVEEPTAVAVAEEEVVVEVEESADTDMAEETTTDAMEEVVSLVDTWTDAWMLNETGETSGIFSGVLVNVASVSIEDINGQPYQRIQASGIPNYETTITQDLINWLNSRPLAAEQDFETGETPLSVGDVVMFGGDAGYRPSEGCLDEGFGYWPFGPVCPSDQDKDQYFPLNPIPATGICETGLNDIGTWVNGVSIFNWGDGFSYNQEGVWEHDAFHFEAYDLDIDPGHSAGGNYHHHSNPVSLGVQLGDDGSGHSPIYGFAADGYPVYGPWHAAGELTNSCWKVRDYSADSPTGCGVEGERSCLFVDQYDISQGTEPAPSAGPNVTDIVTSLSGNPHVALPGYYFQDYYYDAGCTEQGVAHLDEHNGHDHDGLGYHYHVTLEEQDDGSLLDVFPYYVGPTYAGDLQENAVAFCAADAPSGPSGPPSGGGDGPPPSDDGEADSDDSAAVEEAAVVVEEPTPEPVAEAVVEEPVVEAFVPRTAITTGVAQVSYAGEVTSACTNTNNYRTGNYGEITDADGNVWFVPAPVSGGFTNVDVYNDCTGNGDNPDFASELVTQVINEGGTEITGYLFADNYYEMYINGTFAGRDAVNFTTFNSHAVQFQASYPMTYAFLLVDWEEYNGLGMEELRGYHAGDGGFIANFSDGTTTNDDWVCKSFYVAPLDDAGSCLAFDANGHVDSSGCASSDQAISCISDDPESSCSAYHEELPPNWMSPDYDDSNWPAASRYTADDVTNQSGFRNYENTLFSGVNFIWSSNLVLDNAVVCRLTVDAP